MRALIVVNNPKAWPFNIDGVDVIAAREYLTSPAFSTLRGVKVFNLCKSYRYQSLGYYVSLLAAARGHKPMPALSTVQELKATDVVRIRSDELDQMIQRDLSKIVSKEFQLSIYFGRNLAKRYERLASHLYRYFHAPLLRAHFSRDAKGRWSLQRVNTIAADGIPPNHHEFVLEVASEYFSSKRWSAPKQRVTRYDLAILYNPDEEEGPSDERAIAKFARAARQLGISASTIGKNDYASLAEFDGLFIRETTNVNHHTFRFARRAHAEGLVVIDDPDSILRCTNKVYLQELLNRHRVPTPNALIVHRDNLQSAPALLGMPCILKQPDSAFSQGVIKVDTATDLVEAGEKMLARSDLVIAQAFVPTDFDWRIGVINRQALWAAKYYMAKKHWQIVKHGSKSRRYGKVEAISLADVPEHVLRVAVRAADLVGDGLYGVDVKEVGKRALVMEVNDNPSIDAGYEDRVLKDQLYLAIMRVFLERIEARYTASSAL